MPAAPSSASGDAVTTSDSDLLLLLAVAEASSVCVHSDDAALFSHLCACVGVFVKTTRALAVPLRTRVAVAATQELLLSATSALGMGNQEGIPAAALASSLSPRILLDAVVEAVGMRGSPAVFLHALQTLGEDGDGAEGEAEGGQDQARDVEDAAAALAVKKSLLSLMEATPEVFWQLAAAEATASGGRRG